MGEPIWSVNSRWALNIFSLSRRPRMPAPRLPQALPSVEYLRECWDYSPETGVLTWLERPREHFPSLGAHNGFLTRWSGKPAGGLSSIGYLRVGINGTMYLAHRVAWAIHYGEWPDRQLDHINLVRHDNRISNLREVDSSANRLRQVRSLTNTSGFTGVTWDRQRGKWSAQIVFKYQIHNLGRFLDKDDAIAARKAANLRFGFAENHGQTNPCETQPAEPGRLKRDNTSGHVGIRRATKSYGWRASIGIAGKLLELGTFETKEEAIAARRAAEIKYGVADRVSYGSGPAILQDPPT